MYYAFCNIGGYRHENERRAIQEYIEDPMAELILKGEIKEGDTVSITILKDKVKFKVRN